LRVRPIRLFDLRIRVAECPESGAKATALQTLARLSGILEPREVFGLRRVHRRFFSSRPLKLILAAAVFLRPPERGLSQSAACGRSNALA
jgi:hypothetical protein